MIGEQDIVLSCLLSSDSAMLTDAAFEQTCHCVKHPYLDILRIESSLSATWAKSFVPELRM